MQIQRPIVPDQQLFDRNKHFKNWGIFIPLFFTKGIPKLILPPLPNTTLLILFPLISIIISSFDILTLLASILCELALFYALTHNSDIRSESLPILNEDQYQIYKGYCSPCRVFKDKGNQHCQKCGVCLHKVLYHSEPLGSCVTEGNWINWTIFYLLSLTAIVRSIFILATSVSQSSNPQ